MYFDTHAHYDDARFDEDRDELLSTLLPAGGVSLVLNPGCDTESSRTAVQFAEKYDYFYAAVGCHPEHAAAFTEEDAQLLTELAKHPKVKAIGEIGLDYFYTQETADIQKSVFRRQLALAKELGLPVIVHDRDAHRDSLALIDEFPEVRGGFHCYSGSAEMACELFRRGWYLSFTGAITFKNARKAPEVLAEIPMDRIMIETDSPYLAPVPFRGKRNDSRYLEAIAAKIAEIKQLSTAEVARITMENGKHFFDL